MKKIIAIAAMVASTSSFAFMNDGNTNGASNGAHTGQADMVGNASGDAGAEFSMSFKTRTNMKADGKGVGSTNTNGDVYGYSSPYYTQPTAWVQGSK